ncbi:MAG: TonB family protein [Candidatus Latescibacteria bacterium]|nr:TonB family protein [Candidatus Latescibacterota bacterium]
MTASIVGFKTPQADLHRKSPKIFAVCMFFSILTVAVGVHMPLIQVRTLEKKIEPPPVIIQLENIPETRHQVRAPAPKLAIPLEVEDDIMPDDVTIESTDLDLDTSTVEVAPMVDIPNVEAEVETVEEEVFEFYAVEVQPEKINTVVPDYPKSAQNAGIEGTVFVRALVGKTGNVEKVEVLKGPAALHEAATNAAFATKFKPAKQNDLPVSCWVQMPFRFVLE